MVVAVFKLLLLLDAEEEFPLFVDGDTRGVETEKGNVVDVQQVVVAVDGWAKSDALAT